MFLGYTDTTKPAGMGALDTLQGFSDGGTSSVGDIFDSVFEDAKQNNSMFGLQQGFQDIYQANIRRAFDLSGESIPGFETLRFKDIARSLDSGESLGTAERERDNYTVDLDMVNIRLKKLKETNPEIQTFEEMYAALRDQSQKTEQRMLDVSSRADGFGDVVGFMSGMVGAFNSNDPLNIASLPLGGWGKTVLTRIATEAGIGGLAEGINQLLGVRENRELLGLDNSAWRSAQQILFAAGGAAVFRGGFEVAPPVARAVERKVAPSRAAGREMLRALEEVGVPVRDETFLSKLSQVLPFADHSTARAGRQVIEQERVFNESNPLGDTPEGRLEHEARGERAAEEYRAGLENEMNGIETPRTSIFEDMGLRGETRGVPVEDVQRALDEASAPLDAEITTRNETIARLEDDIAKVDEKIASYETRPFSELLREVSPKLADELAVIEQRKAQPGLGKSQRSRIAKAETKIRNTPEGQQAAANREADVASGGREKQIQRAKVQKENKEIRALELRRDRVRKKAQKDIDTQPRTVLEPAAERARAENVQLEDAPAPRIPGIPERGGLSPQQHVKVTMARLTEADPTLAARMDDMVVRVEQSFDEVDGTFDIGASRRVSADMMVSLDDGPSLSLRDHLDDIADNERLVEAVRLCSI